MGSNVAFDVELNVLTMGIWPYQEDNSYNHTLANSPVKSLSNVTASNNSLINNQSGQGHTRLNYFGF
jgi:hypothetical protein